MGGLYRAREDLRGDMLMKLYSRRMETWTLYDDLESYVRMPLDGIVVNARPRGCMYWSDPN
eukprot:12887727-Prorocentrum_lima.AAC.1